MYLVRSTDKIKKVYHNVVLKVILQKISKFHIIAIKKGSLRALNTLEGPFFSLFIESNSESISILK